MGFVAPSTAENPTSGQPATAAWGDAVNTAAAYLATNKPHCRVYNSANISHTTSGTAQVLTFDSERYDVGGCHSTASLTGRLTVPTGEGGLYLIGGHISWAQNSGGYRVLQIRLNGTTIIASTSDTPAAASTVADMSIVTEYPLVATDYLELLANQTSGGALNVLVAANYSPEFWFRWVST